MFLGFLAAAVLARADDLGAALIANTPAVSSSAHIRKGERLSEWLLRNVGESADPGILHWHAPSERGAQLRLKDAIALQLERRNGADDGLSALLAAMPVTGRVLLASTGVRWLQGSAQQDPVLSEGQALHRLTGMTSVAVLSDTGEMCLTEASARLDARAYVRACMDDVDSVDWVWLIQPDGRVRKLGVSAWNAEGLGFLAPGGWVFAPRRGTLSDSVADNISRFLATQFPAQAMYPDMPVRFQATQALHASGEPPTPNAPHLSFYGLAEPRQQQWTASDWGDLGVIQTPSARMESAGAVRSHVSGVYPNTRLSVMFQPLDWFEFGFRYTDIANALYGPAIAGDQTYKDKSVDMKLRLLKEEAFLPQVALGIRDVGGTGLFGSEYLVASKRWGAWDASMGLGWGYMASRGGVSAPLGLLSNSYKTRSTQTAAFGGETNDQSYFHGDAALFGGVQWTSPSGQWVWKAELDGSNYQREPFGTTQPQTSPINWGFVYRYSPGVDFSAALERGNRIGMGLTLHFDLSRLEMPKPLDPVRPQLPLMPALYPAAFQAPELAYELEKFTGWTVLSAQQQSEKLVVMAEAEGVFLQERVDRGISVLNRLAPASARHFVIELQARGLALSRIEINRAEWLRAQTQGQVPSLTLPAIEVGKAPMRVADEKLPPATDVFQRDGREPSLKIGPSYSQILGGPDGFVLFQAGVRANVEYSLQPSTWISGTANARVLENYERFKYDAPTDLPRVRTHQREYVTTSTVTIPNLQITHVEDLGGGHYASAYGGLLESMYAGVGGEWLYRPWKGPLAFGVDANRVRQRSFAQDFGLRDYEVTTGHATAYWDTGWNDLLVTVQVGRYLAGDVGATFDVRRVFQNGTAIGAWATKTNLSAAQFGEGSFDKGIYVTVPFDLLLPKSSPSSGTAAWTPLTRDGGARLARDVTLFDVTSQSDPRAMRFVSNPTSRAANRFRTGDDFSFVTPEDKARLSMAADDIRSVPGSFADVPGSTWLAGAGLFLAASALDSEVDQWAREHQGGGLQGIAKFGNAMPAVMAAGAGAMLTGIAGDRAADTAQTSLLAAGLTLGTNLAVKYAVGRARPNEEKGPSSFDGLGSEALKSSFASNHVATAFALVTPFAQQYDMPYLYALAATTALGRLEQREHWLSDTVAGGLLGYAVGSVMSSQQTRREKGWQLQASPGRVGATKRF
jgi:membrane-associated phospholipid phosphatase